MKHLIAAACIAAGLSTAATAEEHVVELVGASFTHDGRSNENIDLRIHTGDTVRWVWVSGVHNVVSGTSGSGNEGDVFRSGDPVGPPNEFSFTFTDPGEVRYFCELHEFVGMRSSVRVFCPADYNEDSTVNTLDVLAFLNDWSAGSPDADFNGDGSVNTLDVLGFLNAWSSGC